MRHVVILLLALQLSGCAPLPKPFEHDTAEDQSYPRQEKTDIAIVPPQYMPDELGGRVAAALAVELQAYGIVATLQPDRAPLQLSGKMSTRDAPSGLGIEIEIDWSLSGDGKPPQGPMASKTLARTEDYAAATDRLVSRIAQQAAPQVATLMGHPPDYQARSLGQVMLGLNIPPANTTPAAPDSVTKSAATEPQGSATPAVAKPAGPTGPAPPQVKVTVAPVTGAPSDGNRQLLSGMRRALGSSKVVVSETGGNDVFTVVCTVSLTPIDERSTTLVVLWVLKDPSGKEVGRVEQSNAVPAAATRGTWAGFGDIVADAAVEGILQLLEKALAK